MADIARLEQALRNADKAGDAYAAKRFAQEIRNARGTAPKKQSSEQASQAMSPSEYIVDEMGFGLPGKASAGLNALIRAPFTDKTIGEEYSDLRAGDVHRKNQFEAENPKMSTALSIGSGVVGGIGAAKVAGNIASRAAPRLMQTAANSYGLKMAGDAATGAGIGAATAFGDDQSMGPSAMVGGLLGAAGRPVIDAAKGLGNFAGGLVGIGNEKRSKLAVAEALRRSGKSVDDVSNDLAMAAREGQDVYTVADSLGTPGQRMLSGIARQPGDARTMIADNLTNRQLSQGERLSSFVADGLDAQKTAKQTQSALKQVRTNNAAVNYPAALADANPVNLSGVIQKMDDALGANPILGETALTKSEIGKRIASLRGKVSKDGQQLIDFEQTLQVKQDLGKQIDRIKRTGESVPAQLSSLYRSLDEALEASSPAYRAANDTFRTQSSNIKAVKDGGEFARPSTRAENNIPQFQGMTAEQQGAARVGYADSLLAKIDNASLSGTTNKAKPLMTGKAGKELPAFAAPGRGDTLMRQIGREDRMFQTSNAALGGSKTADNIADMAEIGAFDPSIIGNIFSGNFKSAALQGISKGVSTLQGRNTKTRDMIAQILMQNGPTQAKQELAKAVSLSQIAEAKKREMIASILGAGFALTSN